MGQDIVVVRGSQPLMAIDHANLNLDLLSKWVEKQQNGGGAFPGKPISFNKGQYLLGFGESQEEVPSGTRFIANMPNVVFGWRKWVDGRPVIHSLAYPALGQELCPRDELGDLDQTLWEDSDFNPGEKVDPWQHFAVIVLRSGTDLFHFYTSSRTGRIAVTNLLGEYVTGARQNFGKLPIITIGFETRTMKDNKKKSFHVPTFEITGWSTPKPIDNPGPGGVAVEAATVDEAPQAPAAAKKAPRTLAPAPAPAPAPEAPAAPPDPDDVGMAAKPRRQRGPALVKATFDDVEG